MRRPARARDNHLRTRAPLHPGVVGHEFWGAMGGNHPALMGNPKTFESLGCMPHGFPIGHAAHDDAYKWQGCFHALL
jgi:hypothetical protein